MADADNNFIEEDDGGCVANTNWPGKPMRYFGPGNSAHLEKVPTPEGVCSWCEEGFNENDHGLVMDQHDEGGITDSLWHRECLMRNVLGSVAHQRKECSCHDGEGEDEPGLTKREAAKAALAEMEKSND